MNKKEEIKFDNFHIPRWNELPSVDLYLDQVVNLINSCLSPYIFFYNDYKKKENELLTKTMINNYVKNDLIEAPVKKQYSKIHIAKLFAICILKQVYSMQDIHILITKALTHFDEKNAYDKFCDLFEQSLICTFAKKDFTDKLSNSDNSYLFKSVLLSCSYKIYVQNITYEKRNTK